MEETKSQYLKVIESSRKVFKDKNSDYGSSWRILRVSSFVDQILSKEKISTENLSAVSVSKGPGSFTGLRIGFSVAKGLCFPYNIPIIGINSLKILGLSYTPKKDEQILSLIHDKNNSYYSMLLDSNYNEVEKPSVVIIDEIFLSKYENINSLVVVCLEKTLTRKILKI